LRTRTALRDPREGADDVRAGADDLEEERRAPGGGSG
jgi:hypothetical protein